MHSFGQRLRSLREARGWSQERLGFEVGVTGGTVSKWENDRAEPGLNHLRMIRRLFEPDNATLDWLIDDLVHAKGMVAAFTAVRDGTDSVYETSPRLVQSEEEMALLARFRGMPGPRRRGLLTLLLSDTET